MNVLDVASMAKRGLVAALEKGQVAVPNSEQVLNWVDQVREVGFCTVPNFYDSEACEHLREEIRDAMERSAEAVHLRSNGADRRLFGAELAGLRIRKFAENSDLLDAARAFLGSDAINAFTLAGRIKFTEGNLGSGEGWHRDSFFNQFKAIVYLTDVTERNGPFEYISRSHLVREKFADHKKFGVPLKGTRIQDKVVERLIAAEPDRHSICTATMGTLVLVDTTGIHRGMPLLSGERYSLTNYFFPRKAVNGELFDHFKPVLGRHIAVHP